MRYLRHQPEANPFLHWLSHRHEPGVFSCLPDHETTTAREIRRRTQPGPEYEERHPLPEAAVRQARLLAYYLPQFHPNEANDRWWGTGFTEWTNLARGVPRFADHYQPRTPRDLGHYRLDNTETLKAQARMAHEAGIEGFIFYHYWFERHKVFYFKWLPVGFLRFPIGGFQFQYGIFRKTSLVKRSRVVLNHFQAFVPRNRGNLVR
ncbi:glycoside hydrolase family 99-like domain-containing protein [Asaia astilbis]|uniref:glycoside hydrolase family 99-like domain-containing protein n=1 Tax=Asaia astilbis TaxID=610244 RepID=UPI001E4C36F7|nr:glycoside hydrolase family 99-like domain-containing protein [Asaia astilbis]